MNGLSRSNRMLKTGVVVFCNLISTCEDPRERDTDDSGVLAAQDQLLALLFPPKSRSPYLPPDSLPLLLARPPAIWADGLHGRQALGCVELGSVGIDQGRRVHDVVLRDG